MTRSTVSALAISAASSAYNSLFRSTPMSTEISHISDSSPPVKSILVSMSSGGSSPSMPNTIFNSSLISRLPSCRSIVRRMLVPVVRAICAKYVYAFLSSIEMTGAKVLASPSSSDTAVRTFLTSAFIDCPSIPMERATPALLGLVTGLPFSSSTGSPVSGS